MALEHEVPSRELCEKMAAVPELAEAFRDSAYEWNGGTLRRRHYAWARSPLFPAPTVREMLVWLKARERSCGQWVVWANPVDDISYSITDANALVKACIAAVVVK